MTLADLQRDLSARREPLIVGFDIDDTVMFSSPGFWYADQEPSLQHLRSVLSMNRIPPQGSPERARFYEFWNQINGPWDAFSVPKRIAHDLIRMHVAHGDKIYFVTGRPASDPPNDQTTARLARIFGLQNPEPVVFTDLQNKTPFLRERKIVWFYGDADSDITAATAAGARAIRVLRAANSTNARRPQNGTLPGEEVLLGSEND